ncbi:MAG: 4-hydroxybenzoate octaprenyltransferase [Hyphomicrobiaceae bacterium]|nr:4-hydroxybenzoate octaprenyltransferase [Hyphomicrobiaceae bacterium]
MVADAGQNNLVDRFAPPWAKPYLRLMRADRPIGTWLLFWPCAWSLSLAAVARGEAWLNGAFLFNLVLFFIGAFVMRGAGCVWNDITDRHIDARVARTRSRPIPSGQVSVRQALIFMAGLSFAGLLVLLQFNGFTIYLGFLSLLIVGFYPYMKRFTDWPQAVLGLAFGWGALMGWGSLYGGFGLPAILLYAGTISWIIGYDTIYAHQDREDDALIGMKSTALRFGEDSKKWLTLFFGATIFFLFAASISALYSHEAAFLVLSFLIVGLGLASGLLIWQVRTLDIDDPDNCLARFRHAHSFGAAIFFTFLVMWLLMRWGG